MDIRKNLFLLSLLLLSSSQIQAHITQKDGLKPWHIGLKGGVPLGDGKQHVGSVLGKTGYYYKDLYSWVSIQQYGLQANISLGLPNKNWRKGYDADVSVGYTITENLGILLSRGINNLVVVGGESQIEPQTEYNEDDTAIERKPDD